MDFPTLIETYYVGVITGFLLGIFAPDLLRLFRKPPTRNR